MSENQNDYLYYLLSYNTYLGVDKRVTNGSQSQLFCSGDVHTRGSNIRYCIAVTH